LLGGGLREGKLTELIGSSSSGKTHIITHSIKNHSLSRSVNRVGQGWALFPCASLMGIPISNIHNSYILWVLGTEILFIGIQKYLHF